VFLVRGGGKFLAFSCPGLYTDTNSNPEERIRLRIRLPAIFSLENGKGKGMKMMKTGVRLLSLLLVLVLWGGALADPVVLEPNMELELSDEIVDKIELLHPEMEGISPLTGLPMDEPYTPITLVLDSSPECMPQWGVAEADWIVQVPLRRDGDTRMVAVYGSEYPEQAGAARSARMTTLPIANLFRAATAFAGWPPNPEKDISVEYWLDDWDFNKPIRYYNLLNNKYRERVDFLEAPQNLSAHIQEIHASLVKRETKFEKRYFLFADEPLTLGDDASSIRFQFFNRPTEDDEIRARKLKEEPAPEVSQESQSAACTFAYQEGTGYLRSSNTGIFSDRNTGEEIAFANVIVLRSKLHWIGDYPWYDNHLKTCGQMELFQNGKHITGSWYRAGRLSRLVLLDEDGNELSLQRGKTWMIIGDEYTVVSYE